MPQRDETLASAAQTWKQDGWVVADGLVPAELCAEALGELRAADLRERAKPGPVRRPDQHDDEVRFRGRQFDGTTLFPFPDAPALNRLFVHPSLVEFAKAALETDDVRLYQSRVWSKYGDHTNYEQPHHRDVNHSLIPTRNGPGFGHIEMFVYLHDVGADTGAPRVAPGFATGLGGVGTQEISTIDKMPELYENEQPAAGSTGSMFAYRSDVWHRGTDIPDGHERHVLVIAFRPAAVDWIGFDAHQPLVSLPAWIEFVEGSSPEELALFGIPRPGHEFYTAEVVDAFARHYPGLDVTPWRDALQQSTL
jgi:hypothetical protein